jgi:D-ribose pyranase
MIKSGILNPALNSLLCRVRHTNTLVIADRGFPYWPEVETVDISLIDDIPTVLDVIHAVRQNFHVGAAFMAQEFKSVNRSEIHSKFEAALNGVVTTFEPHVEFKKRVIKAIGLIRTGDTVQYANVILESA